MLGFLFFAYMLGSIPWGLFLTQHFGYGDIRQKGSGNIGATNVRRVAGSWLAIGTLMGDLTKGAVPVWIAVAITSSKGMDNELYPSLVALSAVLGHLFPIYTKLRGGGKGVSTAAGCFLILSPMACIAAIFVFVSVVYFSNRVSIGSLSAAALLPAAIWINTRSMEPAFIAFITAILIFFRHKDNIRRLFSGTEPVLRERKR
jgi:glycerol-3-phosphate acyltransferase PlsY